MYNSMSKQGLVFFICVWAIWRIQSYPAPSSIQPQPLSADPPERYLVDEVIVCVDDTGKGEENVQIHFEVVKLIRRFSTGITCFTAVAKRRRKRAADEPVEEYPDEEINRWRSLDGIVLAKQHERAPRVLKTTTPDDTYWSSMWPVNGDVSPSQKVTEVWDMGYNGSDVIVAVVDNGVEMDHPDLAENLAGSGHLDLVDNDTDVTPPASSSHSHGTRVSGFVSAVKDNQECVVGLAYGAKLIGIRLFSAGDFPLEANEALAFSHGINDPTLTIDIFSNSWGPPDQYRYWPIGEVPLMALEDGIKLGREGKGAIYVFAAGDGSPKDNCNADGYANSIYTVTITSVGNDGTPPDYSEICAPALAALYSGSDDKTLRSTSNIHQCVSGLKGTSYSAPQGAAIIALALQANPALTWRDIQHLIVLSTTTEGLSDTYGWTLNGAGKNVSQILGFGLLQAEDIVQCATGWATIADNKTYEATERVINSALSSTTATVSDTITISGTNVRSIEHVQVLTTFQCSERKKVSMILTSPSGTNSFLMTERRYDTTSSDNVTFTFMSVHFWGENPDGSWTISMSIPSDQTGTLYSWKLTIHGTESNLQTKVDSCCTEPCLNNGTCNKLTKYTYDCACLPCYSGDLCQNVDSCCIAGDPCQNNGTCNRLSNTNYTCTCPALYSGDHCEDPPDGPIIQNHANGSTYTVIEGVSQTLTCTISGGVPLATLSWTCPGVSDTRSFSSGDTVSRSVTWSATRQEDGDLCTCKSLHAAANWFRSTSIIVRVEYQPSITPFTERKIIKGNRLSVPCNANGVPAPSYTWTRSRDRIFQRSGSTLILDNIQTEYADDYTCHASNTMNPTVGISTPGQDSQTLNIDVLFPPEVKAFPSVLHVVLGRTVRAKCNASGSPLPTYQWTRTKDSATWNTAKLEIASVMKTDADTYTCTATNVMDPTPNEGTSLSGTDSKNFIVDVLYMATVSELVMLSATNNEINEGDTLSLRCRVEGNPAPTVTIKFATIDSVLSELPFGLIHTYTKQQAECLDQGTYGCVAHNFINGASDPVAQIEVIVRCTPRYDHRRTIETAYYSSRGQNVTFYLYLISSPPPTEIRWFKDDDKETEITDGVVNDSLSSILSLFISTEDMFGNYTAVATYDNQEFSFYYFLIPRGPESKEPTQTKESNVGLIVGCLSGGIVIGTLTVGVVLVMKRKGTSLTAATSNTAQLYDNLASRQEGEATYSELQTNGAVHAYFRQEVRNQHSTSKAKPSAHESIELEPEANYGDLNPRTSEGKTAKGIYENTFIA